MYAAGCSSTCKDGLHLYCFPKDPELRKDGVDQWELRKEWVDQWELRKEWVGLVAVVTDSCPPS